MQPDHAVPTAPTVLQIKHHVVLALEGPDGAGKTAHAKRLGERLAARCPANGPARVASYAHHPLPPVLTHSLRDRALWYATRRAVLGEAIVARPVSTLVVSDRWWWSTLAMGAFESDLIGFAEAEALTWEASVCIPVVTVALDAPDAVLAERIGAREREGRASVIDTDRRQGRLREWTRSVATSRGWPVVSTDGDFEACADALCDAVVAALLAGGHARAVDVQALAPAQAPQ